MTLTQINPESLYSSAEACELIPSRKGHLHLRTIQAWLRKGRIKGTRIGGLWFVKGADLLRFLEEGDPDGTQATAVE